MTYYDLIDEAKSMSDALKALNVNDDDFYVSTSYEFHIMSRDLFREKRQDSVPLTKKNFSILRQSIVDAQNLGLTVEDGLLLFCCRERHRRPRPEMYKLIAECLHPALNECEPHSWSMPMGDIFHPHVGNITYPAKDTNPYFDMEYMRDSLTPSRHKPWYERLFAWILGKA